MLTPQTCFRVATLSALAHRTRSLASYKRPDKLAVARSRHEFIAEVVCR